MFLLCLKDGKYKINTVVFIAEEICPWLSSFHKQTVSPFTPPTEMTATVKNLVSRSQIL